MIATFELEDGSIHVEQFTQLVRYKNRKAQRLGDPYVAQAAARADELGAKILALSSPTTILRDLQGTRQNIERQSTGRDGLNGTMQSHPSEEIDVPEKMMLARIGRLDLLPARRRRRDETSTSIRRVRAPRTA